jgi:hypothetical protein
VSICSICGQKHHNKFSPSPDGKFIYGFMDNPTLCPSCEKDWLGNDELSMMEKVKWKLGIKDSQTKLQDKEVSE